MLKKELKIMINNKAYLFLLILPALLAFFMSEGTKGYLDKFYYLGYSTSLINNEVLYTGKILFAKTQFAISELNFMLMMISSFLGLNILEERSLHIWDRIIDKFKFLLIKAVLHYIYALLMIIVSALIFKFLFEIDFSFNAILITFTVPIISLCLGTIAGIFLGNRTVLSNTVLMIVMLFGYFGGALSLSSVLSTTKYMNYLIYLSPLTLINKILFMEHLGLDYRNLFFVWIVVLVILTTFTVLFVKRRLKNDTIL